jgi:hypothetical protein
VTNHGVLVQAVRIGGAGLRSCAAQLHVGVLRSPSAGTRFGGDPCRSSTSVNPASGPIRFRVAKHAATRGVTINGGGGHVIVAFRFPILGTPYNATAILTPVSGCAGGLPDVPSRERAPPHARIVATRPPSAWHTLHRARPHAPVDGPTV